MSERLAQIGWEEQSMLSSPSFDIRGNLAFFGFGEGAIGPVDGTAIAKLNAALDQFDANPNLDILAIQVDARCSWRPHTDARAAWHSLSKLTHAIEQLSKPIVVAAVGTLCGPGMAIFLAAHYRMADKAATGAFPEASIGWLPGAGTTQRLPRLVGAKRALDLLADSAQFPLADGAEIGLTDVVFEGDALDAATKYCTFLSEVEACARPVRDRYEGFADPAAYHANVLEYAPKTVQTTETVQHQALRLVEAAALLPFEAGCAMEEDALDLLAQSDETAGLTHAYWVEHEALHAPPIHGSIPYPPECIAVLGTGELALKTVILALSCGVTVCWGADDREGLNQNMSQLVAVLGRFHAAGGGAAKMLARLSYGSVDDALKSGAMVLDASRCGIDVKVQDAPLIRVIYGAVHAPLKTLGLCFHGAINARGLAEILSADEGEQWHLARLFSLVRAMQKTPIVLGAQTVSAVSRLVHARARAADALVDMGAEPYEIDRALRDWGWQQLPFVQRDRAGLGRVVYAAGSGTDWSGRLLDAGRRGCVDHKGFYDWTEGRPRPSPDVQNLLAAQRPTAHWTPQDINRHIVAALANEGMKLVEQGVVVRAADIDVIALKMMGFPRLKGGPMAAVAKMGQFQAAQILRLVDHPDHTFWHPCATWLAAG